MSSSEESSAEEGCGEERSRRTLQDATEGAWMLKLNISVPSQTQFHCEVCTLNYTTLASLRRHLKTSHSRYTVEESFSCDVCGKLASTLKAIKAHQKSTHIGTAPQTATFDDDANSVSPCPYCPLRFPSKKSLGQHVRGKHMDEASSERAAASRDNDGKRKLWDPVEVDKFKEALRRLGPSSNVDIANEIGTRTCKQVGVFKRAFLLKNPTWLTDNRPSDTVPAPPLQQIPLGHVSSNLDLNLNLNTASSPSSPCHPAPPHATCTLSPPLSQSTTVCTDTPRADNAHTSRLSPPFVLCTPPSSPLHVPALSLSHAACTSSPPLLSQLAATCASLTPSSQLAATCASLTPSSQPVSISPSSHAMCIPIPHFPHIPASTPPPPVLPLPSLPLAAYSPSTAPSADPTNEDINASLRAPFYSDVRAFYGRVLQGAEWEAFCKTLLSWAHKIRLSLPTSQTSHPTTGWARRRHQGHRPPPSQSGYPDIPPSEDAAPRHPGERGHHRRASGRQREAAKASQLQRSYRFNPGACIRKILDDTPPTYCTIPEPELIAHFSATYAPPQPISEPPPWLVALDSQEDVLATPFTPSEVLHQMQRAKKSAPGSDKLTYANWKWADPEGVTLAAVFNICREAGHIPPDWKGSTVTLLPKGGDPTVVRNWRPICLQKTIYKLYSAAIARRIADWAMTSGSILPTQKGFLPYDGCAEHSFVLRSALNDSRRRKRNVVLAWLDLRDAFGSVSHELLLLMMSRLGLTGKTIDVVNDIYKDATVAINTGRDTYTTDIAQSRGVKQGCPLSPLLFNIALEGLLRHLGSCNHGYSISNSVLLNHLAYADDVCILAGSRMQAQALLDRCTEFTSWAGLTFNPQKCGTLCLRNSTSPVSVDPEPFHLGPAPIPALTWRQRYKYLGCPVGAMSSADLTAISTSYLRDCEVIMSSHLAEWQKLDAYRRFIFPRLQHVFRVFFPGSSWCRKIDTRARKWLKKAVRLPLRSCTGYLYTPQALGGLGIPSCEDHMHVARVAQAFKFLADTRDPAVRHIAVLQLSETIRKRLRVPLSTPVTTQMLEAFLNTPAPSQEGARGDIRSLWSSVRASLQFTRASIHLSDDSASLLCGEKKLTWGQRGKVNEMLNTTTQARHLTTLQQSPDQGRASFSTSLCSSSNYFTYTGAFLSFPQYRFVLKARLNLLPTRTVQMRSGTNIPDARCRICHQHTETLAHLINHCHYNLDMVRERHNAVLERVIRAIPPSLGEKYKEQPLPNTTGANRPDLTIVSPDGRSVILLDVSIPFEGCPEALQEAAQSKLTKYEPLRQQLLERYDTVEVLPGELVPCK